MQYQVPQFIEVEDKIFGPLTFKQMIYLVGGAALSYLIYAVLQSFLPFFIIFIILIPVIACAIALAFYKVNNRPFIDTVESALKYVLGGKLYIWKKETKTPKATEGGSGSGSLVVPKLSDSKLKDMAWALDVKQGNIFTGTDRNTLARKKTITSSSDSQ